MKLSDIPIVVADSSTSALSTSTAPAKPTPALAAGAPAAASPGVIHPTVGQSLRRKAVIVFTCLVAYVMAVGIYLYSERDDLVASVHALEAVHQDHELLTRVNAVVSQAILVVNEAHFAADREPDWGALAISVESVQAGLLAAASRADELGTLAVGLQQLVGHLLRDRSRQRLTELRASIQGIVGRLDVATAGLRDRRQHLSLAYRRGFDELSMKAVGFATVGLTIFGSVMALFFARLAWDIRRLERRAMRIVSGYRGSSLKVTRDDEVGALMQSVNQMQSELRARESRLELSRQEQMHKEKMAAIGALASGIAHEINNPIAAIAGVAEEISVTREARHCPHHGAACRPELILEHARRVSAITRQISTFSAPASPQAELIDVNGVIESVCAFVRYDQRYRRVDLRTELDRAIPAAVAVADHLTQVLMNLLVNAADACAELDRPAVVEVRTVEHAGGVQISVHDNGSGMTPHALAHAFDEYFTTKPPGKGTGLGLSVCRRLLEGVGATIELTSVWGEGTTAILRLMGDAPMPKAPSSTEAAAASLPTRDTP